MPDVFEFRDRDSSSTSEATAFADKVFRTQPRLVPMALVWISPLVLIVVGGAAGFMASERLDGLTTSGATAWAVFMILVACVPWVAVCLLPVLQRRHLLEPGPFFRFCRWTSWATVTVFPVLWVAGWVLGDGDPMGRGVVLWATILMYTLAAGLFPIAARLNHAAWLRALPERPRS